jgi:uncharacterized protein
VTTFVPEQETIFITLAGSHAHGTSRIDSDVDLRGVAIAPRSVRFSYLKFFEQYDGLLSTEMAQAVSPAAEALGLALDANKVEVVIFDVVKFFRLCAAANPNVLEILFSDRGDWLLETPAWAAIFEKRNIFLSRRICETYVGYAMAQLKRIKSHRSWLLNPPLRQPTRKEFGLPESSILSADDRNRVEEAIAAKLRSWTLDDLEMTPATRIAVRTRLREFWLEVTGLEAGTNHVEQALRQKAAMSVGLSRDTMEILDCEKRFRAAQKHWQSYQTWKTERNPVRADLEARYGYDTKHAMHLIRLMRSGLELVGTGELRVKRSDAAQLLDIRNGAMNYDDVVGEAQRLEQMMRERLESSPLPRLPDEKSIDELLVSIIQRFSR